MEATVAQQPLTQPDTSALVSVRGLKTYYPIRGSFLQRLVGREAGYVKAVDDVSFDLYRGEVLGLVGESGSGKTTLGRTLLGLVKANEGSIVFDGDEITGMSERELRALRRQHADRLPGPARESQPGDDDRAVRRASADDPQGGERARVQAARRRSARDRRPLAGRAVHVEVPVRPLGRSETARGDRKGDHPQPGRSWLPTSPCRCWT